jgi:hypothetical protein
MIFRRDSGLPTQIQAARKEREQLKRQVVDAPNGARQKTPLHAEF